ncbi:MAG: hypothetical protein Q9164_005517 [Protoblastenia rupestris]
MPEAFTLYNLLAREHEPTALLYQEVTKVIVSHADQPQQISNLVREESLDETLLYLTTRSHRLVKTFDALRDFQKHVKSPAKRQIADQIAEATTTFLLQTLIPLCEVLESAKHVALLSSALSTCLTVKPPSALRYLAGQLAACSKLLQTVVCDQDGGRMIQMWVDSPILAQYDPKILCDWTIVMVQMVASCPGCHDSARYIQEWKTLEETRDVLSEISLNLVSQPQRVVRDTRRGQSSASPLDLDHRKTAVAGLQLAASHICFPDLRDNPLLIEGLKYFDLLIPESERSLANVLDDLRSEKTISVLRAFAATFPCSFCKETLLATRSLDPHNLPAPTHRDIPNHSDELLQFLGNVVGDWKISLSAPAFKSIQSYYSE